METITLKRDHHLAAWMSIHSDPEVKHLFGTDTLTTPYRASVKSDYVLAEIQKANPDRIVQLA